MEANGKLSNAGELADEKALKTEKEWLSADMEFQESVVQLEPLQPIELYALVPQTHEYLKSELILDEKTSDSAVDFQKQNQDELNLHDSQQSRDIISERCNEACELGVKIHPKDLTETQKSQIDCKFCPRSNKLKSHLKQHSRIHEGNCRGSYACGQCGRHFLQKYSFNRHMTTHAENRQREFNCQLCERAFLRKESLVRHQRVHTGDTYNCQVCGASFTRKQSLSVHVLRKHSGKTQPIITDTDETPSDASIHKKGELISDEEFIDEGNRSDSVQGSQKNCVAGDDGQHCGVSTPEKNSEICELNSCPKENQANGEQAHQCELCDRSFKKRKYLKKHLITHAENRKRDFSCHICESKFYTKGHLALHMRIHSGKIFNCELCGARFRFKGNLNVHMLRQHAGDIQQCTPDSKTLDNRAVRIKTELTSDEEFLDET